MIREIKAKKSIIILSFILIMILAFFSKKLTNIKKSNIDDYRIYTAKLENPLYFEGIVIPEKNQDILNNEKFAINKIFFSDGDYVDYNVKIAEVVNIENKNKADSLIKELNLNNFKIENYNKKIDELINNYNSLVDKYNNLLYIDYEESIDAELNELEEQITKLDVDVNELTSKKNIILENTKYLEYELTDLSSKIYKDIYSDFPGYLFINEDEKRLVSDNKIIQAYISEFDFEKIKENQTVNVIIDSNRKLINGVIKKIEYIPSTSSTSREATQVGNSVSKYRFLVFSDAQDLLKYGYNVKIKYDGDTVRLPRDSVIKEDGKYFVYKYLDGKVKKETINIKEDESGFIVETGVNIGDEIIENPKPSLENNDRIDIEND